MGREGGGLAKVSSIGEECQMKIGNEASMYTRANKRTDQSESDVNFSTP